MLFPAQLAGHVCEIKCAVRKVARRPDKLNQMMTKSALNANMRPGCSTGDC